MSVKLARRSSSKKKKPPKDNAQAEVLNKLGLEAFWTTPLDPASMLDISTWTLENPDPLEPKDLPNAFLRRLWLLSPDARSPCFKPLHNDLNTDNTPPEEMVDGFGGTSQCAINPLDLVTAVFMSANTFLQQEMTVRMLQCQFAVPLVLPSMDPKEIGHFLLWPLRGAVSQWRSHFPINNRKVHEGDLASTCMPLVSCVKLGHSGVSKSQVLNRVINGLSSPSDTFLHRGVDGGELPRRLSNGLVEIAWHLPTGDTATDIFPVPVVIANLRGDASTHEKYLSFLCQASSAVVVFCGNLREREKPLLVTCKDMASKLILIDLSDPEEDESRVVGFICQNLQEYMRLPGGSILQGKDLSEEELANGLCGTLKDWIPDELKRVSLEAAATLAGELGLTVDEGPVCKKAMTTVEEVLRGLDEGSAEFREKQLPLQGPLWSKLAKIQKQESKQRKEGKEADSQLKKEKKDILVELSTYKMTPAMKIFTDMLFTTDKVERTYFLSWMKLRLQQKQIKNQNSPQDLFTNLQKEMDDDMSEHYSEFQNGLNSNLGDSDSFCSDSTFEEETTEEQQVSEHQFEIGRDSEHILQKPSENTTEPKKEHYEGPSDPDTKQHLNVTSNEEEILGNEIIQNEDQDSSDLSGETGTFSSQLDPELTLQNSDSTSSAEQQMYLDVPLEPDPSSLGLEHFLREMGLIFELTHISPGSGSHNVLRLPSLATDLLLYGIPLELMDGDASNIPISWLSCVFAELKRRLPQDQCRTRVLTNLGAHHGRNAEVLSALFGVKFPDGRQRATRGVYMVALCLPDNLRLDMECDFLLLIDVEGLCSLSLDRDMLVLDNEMATVATGLSDVLMQNISSHAGMEFENNLGVIVSALLRIKEYGSMPSCQLLTQDEEINSILQATQLKRVSDILQTETGDRETSNAKKRSHKTTTCITRIKGPWYNKSLSEPVDTQYNDTVLKLKQNLFGTLRECAAKSKTPGLPEFMSRLCAVWDEVKAESFSIGLQNNDTSLAFSLLCTKLSKWEEIFLEHIENWVQGATKKIIATKARALDAAIQNGLLSELKDEAREEVKTEVDKLRSKIEASLMEDNLLKMTKFRPILMGNMDDLQEQVTEEIIERLGAVNENHCSSTQLEKFETLLGKEQELKLQALVENSKSTRVLLQDTELQKEFEGVWRKTLSDFDFRLSERDDITARVINILKENLINRGLLKHIKKLEVIGQDQASNFQVYDEHFGYRSRLKHMFEDNNRLQRVAAQQIACNVIDEYNQFVTDKSSLPADFSDSYITTLLENVEKALKEKSMEIRSAFEVDLKVYLCSAACKDFQTIHDRFAKDTKVLTCITETKSTYLAEFIYQFRKRDQCQRVAQAFTSMVIKPTVLDYIYRPLGMRIVEDIRGKAQRYQSPRAFQQSLLEELIIEDHFESFLEYLRFYENFRMRKIQETVAAHLSESADLDKWMQQRLGEIVGKVAAAVSRTAEGTNGVLSDTKPLLERVCLTLEKDGDVDVSRASLDGPFFSITTEWDRFITCLMEFLAAMRLDLAKKFSQNVDTTSLLECLPNQPQVSLFNRVKGCEQQCPLCGAPCEKEEMGHEVHQAVLHRPRGMLPQKTGPLSCTSFSESMTEGNPGLSTDANDTSAYRDLHSLYPDWNFSTGGQSSQMPNAYWRYVLVRFSGRFAEEYEGESSMIPEEWKKITKEEALNSLKEAFLTGWSK